MNAPQDRGLLSIARIATDAHGRYKAGFSLIDAIDAAISGHELDDVTRGLIESQVMASICREAQDEDGMVHSLRPAIEALGDSEAILPVIVRARAADLLREEAAILSIAAHHDPLWTIVHEIARTGFARMILPPFASTGADPAGRQNRLSQQISRVLLDDRLVALVNVRNALLSRADLTTLAAATRSKEIWEALAQIRTVITATRF